MSWILLRVLSSVYDSKAPTTAMIRMITAADRFSCCYRNENRHGHKDVDRDLAPGDIPEAGEEALPSAEESGDQSKTATQKPCTDLPAAQ